MEVAIIITTTPTISSRTAKTIFKLAVRFTLFLTTLNRNLDKIPKGLAVRFFKLKTAMPRPQGEYFWRYGLFAQKRGSKTYPYRQNPTCGVCNPYRQTFWRAGGFFGGGDSVCNDYVNYNTLERNSK